MAGRLSLAGVFALTLMALFATPVAANDETCIREAIGRVTAANAIHPVHAAIDAIYPAPAADVATADDATGPELQMIMVRVKDGKPVMACVDSRESATKFLNAPVEKIHGKHAEEK